MYFTGEVTIRDIVELLRALASLLWPVVVLLLVSRLSSGSIARWLPRLKAVTLAGQKVELFEAEKPIRPDRK